MWLVVYDDNIGGFEGVHTIEYCLYDSFEKAKAGALNLMDAMSPWGNDWRNGVEGLGREDEDNYLGFDFNPELGGSSGEALISNEDSDDSHKVLVTIKPLKVNPPPLRVERSISSNETGLAF